MAGAALIIPWICAPLVWADDPSPGDPAVSARETLALPRQYLSQGKNHEAAESLEEMAALHPGWAELYSLWAVALARGGQKERALGIIERGLRYSPQDRHLIQARKMFLGRKMESGKEELLPGMVPAELQGPLKDPLDPQPQDRRVFSWSLAARSAALPGWGQWKAGSRGRALVMAIPTMLLAGGGIYAGWAQRKARQAYLSTVIAGEAERQYQRALDLRSVATGLTTMAATLWFFGILDAGFIEPGSVPGPAVTLRF